MQTPPHTNAKPSSTYNALSIANRRQWKRESLTKSSETTCSNLPLTKQPKEKAKICLAFAPLPNKWFNACSTLGLKYCRPMRCKRGDSTSLECLPTRHFTSLLRDDAISSYNQDAPQSKGGKPNAPWTNHIVTS